MEWYKLAALWIVSVAPSLFAVFVALKDFLDIRNKDNGWGDSTELHKAVLSNVKLINLSDTVLSRIVCNTYCYNLRKEVVLLTISGLFPIILSFIQLGVSKVDMDNTAVKIAIVCLGVCGLAVLIQIYFVMEFLKLSFEDFFKKYEKNSTGAFKQQVVFHLCTSFSIIIVSGLVVFVTSPQQ